MEMSLPKENLIENLKLMVNNEQFSDVKFKVGKSGVVMYGHIVLLSIASKVLKNMFKGGWLETDTNEVIITDIEPEIFLEILRFIYTREITISEETSLHLLFCADKFMIHDLKKAVGGYLLKSLNFKNFWIRYDIAVVCNDLNLLNVCRRYASKEVNLYLENCWEECGKTMILDILKLDNLNIPEIILFRRVFEWIIIHNYEDKDVLNYIRLDLLDSEGLQEVAKSGIINFEKIINIFQKIYQAHIKQSKEFARSQTRIPRENMRCLLLAAHSDDRRVQDVADSININGIEVNTINAYQEVPSFNDIKKFDCIFYFSYNMRNPVILGDILAKYVEMGKGIVLCSVNALNEGDPDEIKGRIREGFIPMKSGKYVENERVLLGKILIPKHPIMNNVTNFDGGEYSWHIESELNNNSSCIALFNNGSIFISEKRLNPSFGIVVVLNFYAPSDQLSKGFWVSETDGDLIMANALEYVANC